MISKKVEVPEDVEIRIEDKKVYVKGPKGELSRDFDNVFTKDIDIKKEDKYVIVSCEKERRKKKALVGTIAAHIRNMITGVREGFTYVMKIHYVHFPMNVTTKKSGDKIEIEVKNFLGEKKPRKTTVRDVDVEIKDGYIYIKGINKESVGQAATRIEQICKLKSRDRRIFQDGIFLVDKKIGV